MTNLYSEVRKNQIYSNLAALNLLNRDEYRNNELLEALRDFADAMLETVHAKDHASHLSIRHLGQYLLNQAENVGLSGDSNITYAANQLDRLSYRIYTLESGMKGEARANRAMFGIDAPNRILRNVELVFDGEPFEMDFVIINKAGIFAVEAKNFSRKMVIDHNGTLTEACPGDRPTSKKVCRQMANQRAAVRRALTEGIADNDRMTILAESVRSILLTTSDYSIVDLRDKETILDCDTIADYLNNAESMELTRDEINTIADALEKASSAKTYPVGWDYKRVAEAFSIAVAKIEYASDNSDECATSETDNHNHKEARQEHNGWKIAGSAAAITAVVLGASWKIIRRFI